MKKRFPIWSAPDAHQISCAPAVRSKFYSARLWFSFHIAQSIGWRARQPLSAAIGANVVTASLLLTFLSCNEQAVENDKGITSTQSISTIQDSTGSYKTPIGATGFTINLPLNYRIQSHQNKDSSFVYYFRPADTTLTNMEGGMYLGKKPDILPPPGEHTVKEFRVWLLGEERTWIEYTTPNYTQRETFIDAGDDNYIHVWCYAENIADLEKLFPVILSIR
ncbi:MAG TPA: hypothetical protein VI731_02810 [Bacteroidia bacterium]|nr:hypothetical protein [Bacteroidia bacterium]